MKKIAVCLLSGGLDSCVAATWARVQGYDLYLLSVNYGQVMRKELDHARMIADVLEVKEHRQLVMKDFSQISRSSRTRADMIEYDRSVMDIPKEIPAAYPPGRDASFIFIASAWLESLMLDDTSDIAEGAVIIGTNNNDANTFPDCRPEVYTLINEILDCSTKISVQYGKAITVVAPFIDKTKDVVVRLGLDLRAPLHLTWTCYEGKDSACGRCDPCALRLWAFERNGVRDPINYRADRVTAVTA